MKQPVRIKILDREYLIKSDENEVHVQNVTQFVNEKFLEIRDNSASLSENKAAMLVSFHIASEYFHAIKERENLLKDIQDRARLLNYKIDSVMA